MEKQPKLKRNKIMKIIPKATRALAMKFQNHPFRSSCRDHKSRAENTANWVRLHGDMGFSHPVVPIISDDEEAGRKSKGGYCNGIEIHFNEEPTSPKISCTGQIIKHKKKQIK